MLNLDVRKWAIQNFPYLISEDLTDLEIMYRLLGEINRMSVRVDQLPEEVQTAVNNWIIEHPEVFTKIPDGYITESKLSNSLKTKLNYSYTLEDTVNNNTLEIAVNSARIDNITSLPEGSTAGDAELIDIRVGADGVTYASAGSAVRSQFSGITNDLDIISEERLSYNLFYLTNDTTRTVNGITISVSEEGYFCINGTATRESTFGICGSASSTDETQATLESGEYIFDRELIDGSAEGSAKPVLRLVHNGHGESLTLKTPYTFDYMPLIFIRVSKNEVYHDAKYAFTIERGNVLHPYSKHGSRIYFSAVDQYARNEIELLRPTVKRLRILGIGNSYTRDCFRWLCKIIKDSGLYDDVIVGHGYIGGVTLAEQYNNLMTNSAVYQYWKYNNSADASKSNDITLDYILSDEPWDIVVLQQQSDEAGQYSSFVSSTFDINDLVNELHMRIDNLNLRIAINATWSHPNTNTSDKFIRYYNGNSEIMYNAIQDTIPRVANYIGSIDFVINTGKAIELARSNEYLSNMGYDLTYDNNHICYGIVQYMAAFVHAYTLLGITPDKVTFYPTTADDPNITEPSTNYLAFIAKTIAVKAV